MKDRWPSVEIGYRWTADLPLKAHMGLCLDQSEVTGGKGRSLRLIIQSGRRAVDHYQTRDISLALLLVKVRGFRHTELKRDNRGESGDNKSKEIQRARTGLK